jgi:quinoprotein glucose dehydrogenase
MSILPVQCGAARFVADSTSITPHIQQAFVHSANVYTALLMLALLAAIGLRVLNIRWQVPLGSMDNFAGPHPGIPPGSINLGGPIATAGGLVFIAGTSDHYLRAFDVETGKELWRGLLPASGHATPMTYCLEDGKQFVVIAAGGHAKISEEPQGDSLVPFTLPQRD